MRCWKIKEFCRGGGGGVIAEEGNIDGGVRGRRRREGVLFGVIGGGEYEEGSKCGR